MKKKIVFLTSLTIGVILAYINTGYAQYEVAVDSFVYKRVDGHELKLYSYKPISNKGIKNKPAIIFFFGGGWNIGSPKRFELQARYLASRGMVAVCPDYRVGSRHHSSALASISDAKSAMRYLKMHGEAWGIDTAKIIAAGTSAGGHLAASLATLDGFNHPGEDKSISTRPLALVLTSPALNIENMGEQYINRFENQAYNASPVNFIGKNMPPTLIMIGGAEKDLLEDARLFEKRMSERSGRCMVKVYDKQKHGFSNYERSPDYFATTLTEMEVFLMNLGVLAGESRVDDFMLSIKK